MMSPFGSEEEQKEALRRALAEQHEYNARVLRFMQEMSGENLGTFIEILQRIVNGDGAAYLHFLLGSAITIQRVQNNLCACGTDHDHEVLSEEKEKLQAERKEEAVDAQHEAAMKEYGMEVVDGKLRCKNCKLEYVSLDDRMLRRPGMDGCHGCQLKSAHG